MTKNLIIFDCDGTLVDSEPLGNLAFSQVLTRHGYPISQEDSIRRFKGMKLADSLAMIEAETAVSMPSTFVNEFREKMSQLFNESLTLIPGALELVESVNIKFCVASNGTKEKTEESLGITGLLSNFQNSIFSAYEVGIWKPNPGLFLHVADYYGVAPSECIVIEDSAPGIRAGIDAGMQVLAFTSDACEYDNPEATVSFNSMFAIHDYLSTHGLVRPRG